MGKKTDEKTEHIKMKEKKRSLKEDNQGNVTSLRLIIRYNLIV